MIYFINKHIILLDLFDYISQTESTTTPNIRDKTYNKIISDFDEFIKNLSDEDIQLLLSIIRKCYYKYQDSIKVNRNSNFEFNTGLLMSILIDQQKQIDKLI